ncbi:MAG TPA: IS21 family transposase, partial [Mycobacterium sp.]|nr:IS21 family transposase [Mycobacterium sp.]
LLHRNLDRVDVHAGIMAALSVGSTSPDVVALEARKAAERRGTAAGPDGADDGGRVVILAEHRSAAVPADERPLPSVDKYDILLGRETS